MASLLFTRFSFKKSTGENRKISSIDPRHGSKVLKMRSTQMLLVDQGTTKNRVPKGAPTRRITKIRNTNLNRSVLRRLSSHETEG